MSIVNKTSNKQINVGKMQIKGVVTMATFHGSPPMERNSNLDCKCLEKGGPDGRQPWGQPSKQKISKRKAPPSRQGKMARKRQLEGRAISNS